MGEVSQESAVAKKVKLYVLIFLINLTFPFSFKLLFNSLHTYTVYIQLCLKTYKGMLNLSFI